MTVMLKELEELKHNTLTFTKKVKASDYIDPEIIKNSEIDDLTKKVENERFKIALVSIFSAGKSTFINSLLGIELLSMDDLAWTATITRIVYSEKVFITVKYRDNRKDEHFSDTYKGEAITPKNIGVLRQILEEKTTVKGGGKEQDVKEVVIGFPFELCKNGIEFIDTPGLGAIHENHDQITNSILPTVQAVIFLFPHDGIDNQAIVYKIKDYIKTAKESKLNNSGEHIFFIMNKADRANESEWPRLTGEIKKLVSDVVSKSEPLPVSALYAMKARAYQNGYITLDSLQRNKNISIPDPEEPDFPIAGKSLTEAHIEPMLVYSRIHSVESTLSKYLESKGDVFIYRLKESIMKAFKDNFRQIEERLSILNTTKVEDAKAHNEKITKLQAAIDNLQVRAIDDINNMITNKTTGTDKDSATSVVDNLIKTDFESISKDTITTILKRWNESKSGIYDSDSAMSVVGDIFDSIPNIFDNNIKSFSNKVYNKITSQLLLLVKKIQEKYEEMTRNISEQSEKETGRKISFDTEHMLKILTAYIQDTLNEIFENNISSDKSEIKSLVNGSYIDVKIPGVKNSIKRGFGGFLDFIGIDNSIGSNSYKSEFSSSVFRATMDGYFEKFSAELKDSNKGKDDMFYTEMIKTLKNIKNEFTKQSNALIKNEIKVLQNMLEKMIINQKQSAAETAKEIERLNLGRNNIKTMQMELEKLLPKKMINREEAS